MFKKFLRHIKFKKYFKPGESIILAVSGGVDSMVLCELMRRGGYTFSVAHVNHMTRQGASDKDEMFVREYCHRHKIKWHFIRLDPGGLAGINFHQYAHKERYRFFKSLGYDKIVTAHHKDDNSETILLNFLKGRSLYGINDAYENIVRPLLIFNKSEILKYAHKKDIDYMEDSSNSETKYQRNYLRNKVIPLLQKRIPNVIERINSLSEKWAADQDLLEMIFRDRLHSTPDTQRSYLEMDDYSGFPPGALYHVIKNYGFNYSQSEDILNSIHNTGAQLFSKTHVITIDRKRLYIDESTQPGEEITIDILNNPTFNFHGMTCRLSIRDDFEKDDNRNVAYFPLCLLSDSLKMRFWKSGDRFYPSGMDGKSQSLKKFFTNLKIDRFKKQEIPILLNEEDIVWLIPYRTSYFYDPEKFEGPYLRIECMHEE